MKACVKKAQSAPTNTNIHNQIKSCLQTAKTQKLTGNAQKTFMQSCLNN